MRSHTFKTRILISVKTYPTLSKKYNELVCTAGFKGDGSWIRLYPAPFRFLCEEKRYKKYQWVELEIEKNPKDRRPESYRPVDIHNISLSKVILPGEQWEQRRAVVLKAPIHTNLNRIISAAKNNKFSLAIFKPKRIEELLMKKVSATWPIEKESYVKHALQQGDLFTKEYNKNFKLMPKLPYDFSYRFCDDEGKKTTLKIVDWEIGQLYWNCLKREGQENLAIEKVHQKYFDDFVRKKDLYLFLGTTMEWHQRSPNPYLIVGTFHPPPILQLDMFPIGTL